MSQLKIGVVEDEMVISDTICLTLKKLGYNTITTAYNYTDALKMLRSQSLELLLLDINLGKGKDGIDLATHVRESYNIPIIFLTANSDSATIERAKKVKPDAYLVKPFNKNDLFVAIEIAVSNFSTNKTTAVNDYIIVKDGYEYTKVLFNELVYVESDQNYALLNLKNGKRVMVRSTLNEMTERLPAHSFKKINRSTIINSTAITSIKTDSVFLGDKEFSISKLVREELLATLNKTNN